RTSAASSPRNGCCTASCRTGTRGTKVVLVRSSYLLRYIEGKRAFSKVCRASLTHSARSSPVATTRLPPQPPHRGRVVSQDSACLPHFGRSVHVSGPRHLVGDRH